MEWKTDWIGFFDRVIGDVGDIGVDAVLSCATFCVLFVKYYMEMGLCRNANVDCSGVWGTESKAFLNTFSNMLFQNCDIIY